MKISTVYDEMVGKEFGRLHVLKMAEPRKNINNGVTRHIPYFLVQCSCGKEFEVHAGHVKSGHTTSCGCFRIDNLLGDKNPTYNPNLTDEQRNSFRTRTQTWAKRVKTRDGFTCQVCGSKERLIAHHLNSYASNEEKRLDVDNGVAMCRECHTDFHVNFMGNYRTPCNEQDFEQYLLQV